MTEYKIGDTITAKFTPAFQDETVVVGVIREFKGEMICCNQVGTNKPFFCLAEEVINEKPMTEIQKAMHWLMKADTGLSSECLMATMLNGGPISSGYASRFHPHDPSDFKRCVDLLNAVPTFRVTLDVMKQVSKQWAVLINHWDELETLLNEEIPQRSAPKTYARMKELFALVEKNND